MKNLQKRLPQQLTPTSSKRIIIVETIGPR